MASIIKISEGVAYSVYDDRFQPIYEALGDNLKVSRATQVEWSSASQQWQAIDFYTGKVIASDRNRSEVIRQEVEYLEGRLNNGSIINVVHDSDSIPDHDSDLVGHVDSDRNL